LGQRSTCLFVRQKWGLSPIMQKIMIIRHAEKHQHGSHGRGVTEDGLPARHELTVRGWQRAAALVHFFAPIGAAATGSAIQTPQAIFASNATKQSPSLRAMHTVGPLAATLGISVNHNYAEDQEPALAAALSTAPSSVLVAWHHGHIARLAKEIAGAHLPCPGHWPDERFDLVWILDRHGSGWSFSQLAQCLLPDDCPDVF
jgi:broad specificity phosphatase PhoE